MDTKRCLTGSREWRGEKEKGATLYSSLVPSFPSWLRWETKQTVAKEEQKRIRGVAELGTNIRLKSRPSSLHTVMLFHFLSS